MDLEELIFFQGAASDSHDAHSSDVVGGVNTEIFWLVVFLNDEVVHSAHCLHEVRQSAAIVRRTLVHKLVVHEGPDPFVLEHVGTYVELDQAVSFVRSGKPLIEIWHVLHGVSAVRVVLGAHDWIM